MKLVMKRSDVLRATLADDCGNVGFIGLAPDGSAYHVVVPVDLQLARGIKAGNQPTDGTPFGGYKGWNYFECPTFESRTGDRDERTDQNIRLVVEWAGSLGVEIIATD